MDWIGASPSSCPARIFVIAWAASLESEKKPLAAQILPSFSSSSTLRAISAVAGCSCLVGSMFFTLKCCDF